MIYASQKKYTYHQRDLILSSQLNSLDRLFIILTLFMNIYYGESVMDKIKVKVNLQNLQKGSLQATGYRPFRVGISFFNGALLLLIAVEKGSQQKVKFATLSQ